MQAAPGYPGAPAPPLDARPRIGEWLSEAFTLFSREWQNWCLIGLVYTVLLSIPIVIGYGAMMAVMFAAIGVGAAAGRNSEAAAGAGAAGALVGMMLGMVVMLAVVLAIHAYLYAGMVRAAVKQLRGERIQVGDLFSGGDVIGPALVTELLQGLGTTVAALLCILPAYLLAGLWVFARPLVVERRLTPGEALRTSLDTTKPHMWMYLVWFILYGIIAGLGSAVGFGVIATIPIAHLMIMVSYRDVFGIPGAVPTVTPGPAGQPAGPYGAPAAPYGTQPPPYAPPPPPPGP